MCLGVGPVINQHSASSNAVLSPVMDAILVVRIGALDVAALDAVVEGLRREVGNVPEPIPLRPGLGVAHVEIVVGHSGRQRLDLVLELVTSKRRGLGHVEREVERHDLAGLDLFRGCCYAGGSEQVESSDLYR